MSNFNSPFTPGAQNFGLGQGAQTPSTVLQPLQPFGVSANTNFQPQPSTQSSTQPSPQPQFQNSTAVSPFTFFTPPQNNNQFNSQPQFFSAIEQDRINLQNAADRQFNRLDSVNNAFAQGLQQAAASTREIGMNAATSLESLGASQRAQFEADRASIISDFKDTTAQQGAATVLGLRRSFENTNAQLAQNPDLTAAQRTAVRQRLELNVNEQTSAQLANQGVAFNSNFAQLQSGLLNQSVQSQQLQANLSQLAEQTRVATEATALQFEVAGLTQLSSLIRANPESVFSTATGLAQLLALSSAPSFTGASFGSPSSSSSQNAEPGSANQTFFNTFPIIPTNHNVNSTSSPQDSNSNISNSQGVDPLPTIDASGSAVA